MERIIFKQALIVLVVSIIAYYVVIIGFFPDISNLRSLWVFLALLLITITIDYKIVFRKYIKWDEKYSVGIESIDNDHKKLILLINKLQMAVDNKTSKHNEKQIMGEVIDYTKYHFGREEGLMHKYDYPDYIPHQAQHKKMISIINEFIAGYEKDEKDALQYLLTYLQSWLIEHINGTDQEYSEFLISKGVN